MWFHDSWVGDASESDDSVGDASVGELNRTTTVRNNNDGAKVVIMF